MKKLIHKLFYKKTKLFISGKVSGTDLSESRYKFLEAELYFFENELFDLKNIVNPMELGLTFSDSWIKCMAVTIWHLLPCSHIYMLKDWKESKGARIERWVAKKMFKTVIYEK